MSEKFLFLELWTKISRPIKMQDSLDHKSHKLVKLWKLLDVIDPPQKQQIDSVISTGCGQVCLGMPKVMPNSKPSSYQEWV